MVKCLPTMQEIQVHSLGWEGLLEKEVATHSSILVWKIPWMEKPGRLQSMGSQRVRHDWGTSLSLSWVWVLCLITQLCLTLCELMDDSQPGFSVHGIIRARILEWVVIFSSRGCSWPRDHTCLSCVLLLLWQLDSLPLSHLGSFLLEEDGRLLPVFSHSLPSVCVYVQISSSYENISCTVLGSMLMTSF